ncbi:MAG: TrmH family RNA methyltransferase [Bdellovibrionales bacterium]
MEKNLKDLYKLARSIEAKLGEKGLLEEDRFLFCKGLLESENPKLQGLAGRVKQGMGLTQFLCFVIPIERELNNKITDSEILVETEDVDKPLEAKDLIIVLDNIRSPFNMGAIVRTCDALGVRELIATGYTPDYSDERVKKISMGAWAGVSLKKLRDLGEVREYLSSINYKMICVETVVEAENIFDVDFEMQTALIFGNERFGLSKKDLSLCDGIVKLPVFGVKNSLNVNAALTACGYEWIRQNG